jgi:hypothetical protein
MVRALVGALVRGLRALDQIDLGAIELQLEIDRVLLRRLRTQPLLGLIDDLPGGVRPQQVAVGDSLLAEGVRLPDVVEEGELGGDQLLLVADLQDQRPVQLLAVSRAGLIAVIEMLELTAELGEVVELGAQLALVLVPALGLVGHPAHQGRRRTHLLERPRGELAEGAGLGAQRVAARHPGAELRRQLGKEAAGILARRAG